MAEDMEPKERFGRVKKIASSFAEYVSDWAETAFMAGMLNKGKRIELTPDGLVEPVEHATPAVDQAGGSLDEIMDLLKKMKKGEL
jgi:hypothetical protein